MLFIIRGKRELKRVSIETSVSIYLIFWMETSVSILTLIATELILKKAKVEGVKIVTLKL